MTATCALHPNVISEGTCARCGRFCCLTCVEATEPLLCAACLPLVRDPLGLSRSPFSPFSAIGPGMRLALGATGAILGICVVFSVPAAFLQALYGQGDDLKTVAHSGVVLLSNLYDAIVGAIGSQAVLALLIARAEGRSLSISGAFSEGLGNWARCLGATIRTSLTVLGFALLLVVPGIWKAVLLAFVSTAALRSQEVDALERSGALVRGRWGQVFLLLLASGAALYGPALVAVSGMAAAGDALGIPLLVQELVSDLIERLVRDGLMGGVMLVAYLQLHATVGVPLKPMRWRARQGEVA